MAHQAWETSAWASGAWADNAWEGMVKRVLNAYQIFIRKHLAAKIESERILGDVYAFNDFTVEETWLPREDYKALTAEHSGGKIYLTCKAISEGDNKSRGTPVTTREIEIMLAYQRGGVDGGNLALVDEYLFFVDQLYSTCQHLESPTAPGAVPFQWRRNEALVDENEIAFDFVSLQTNNLLEVYFSAVYLVTIT